MASGGEDNQPISVGGLLRQPGGSPSDLGSVNLGSVNIGEMVYVWVRWDQPNKKLFFGLQRKGKNQLPVEMEIGYSAILSDMLPPKFPGISVQVQTSPLNGTGYQTYSDVMAKIDQVSVIR